MSTSASTEAIATFVWFDDENLWLRLADGRRVSIRLGFYPRLRHATPVQRANWELIGEGIGIHWEDIDEDLHVGDLVAGNRDSTKLGREHHASCADCRQATGQDAAAGQR